MLQSWINCQLLERSQADVYLAVEEETGKLFVVKTCNCDDKHKTKEILNEITIFLVLETPRVVQYLGSSFTVEDGKKLLNVFLEYMPGGSLRKHILKLGGRLGESLIKTYTRGIVEALHHLHGKGIVHGDIKAENVLVGLEGVKLCDFGGSRFADQDARGAMKGTSAWMAPEVVAELDQGFPSDIWSLGCTVIEMATGQDPWGTVPSKSDLKGLQLSRKIPDVSSLSREGQRFLRKCLVRNPKKRWTAAQLLQEKFLAKKVTDLKTTAAVSPALARIRATFPDQPGKMASNEKLRKPRETISKTSKKQNSSRPTPPSLSSAHFQIYNNSQSVQTVIPRFLGSDRSSALLEFELQPVQLHEKSQDLNNSEELPNGLRNDHTDHPTGASESSSLPESSLLATPRVYSDHSPVLSLLEELPVQPWEITGGLLNTIPFGPQRLNGEPDNPPTPSEDEFFIDEGLLNTIPFGIQRLYGEFQNPPTPSEDEFFSQRTPRTPQVPMPPRVFFRDLSNPSSHPTSENNFREKFMAPERSSDRFPACSLHRDVNNQSTTMDTDPVYTRNAPSPASDILSNYYSDHSPAVLLTDSLDTDAPNSDLKVKSTGPSPENSQSSRAQSTEASGSVYSQSP